jgi:hypothetical protein
VPLLDDRQRTLMLGFIVGAGTVLFGRELFMPMRRLARPAAKAALGAGFEAMERGREAVALMSEHVADLLAEVQAERSAPAADAAANHRAAAGLFVFQATGGGSSEVPGRHGCHDECHHRKRVGSTRRQEFRTPGRVRPDA